MLDVSIVHSARLLANAVYPMDGSASMIDEEEAVASLAYEADAYHWKMN